METAIPYFPMHAKDLTRSINIRLPRPMGITASVFAHEVARKMPSYATEIHSDGSGTGSDGSIIRVNSLGRWLFGVPGYQGNIRITSQGTELILSYSAESPALVESFLQELKENIEQSN